ncbi:fasciclin domain-containing protein [Albimonas pacifica]|uniref:Uncaracterized surface protein containing fasciclin (FAS1) repeats n=1 Tax=Albimonas pacifica TaxID=1114924 RepID=A0A1I3I4N3_9RHOB|nr:fasciclin domain-containing protein [Albimonas pacifica]SFI42829.1 Uncaracterized surface protein containing fasciclin (FAS1) repeats [Albimonas pacifica]
MTDIRRASALTAFAFVASMGAAALASSDMAGENPMVGGAPMYADKTIVQNAVNSQDHETLVAAVKAAGLVEVLSGEGPFTVFAPTDAAFEALPAGTVQTLLEPGNKATLQKILACHVVSAKAMSEAIKGMIADDGGVHPVPTLGGCTLRVWNNDGMIMIEDERGDVASVTIADVVQSNGVIHVIDTVLLPKG